MLLSMDPAGSHIIDACWAATSDMHHYRERIARELSEQSDTIRDDFFGKRVWRNWKMDGFTTKRFEWGREGSGQEARYAKKPAVKKKPWQKMAEKKQQSIGRGVVTKHFSAIDS